MKKALLIITIIGVCLLIAGGAIFASVMAKNNWDFSALANVDTAEEHYSVQASEVTSVEAETTVFRIVYQQTDGDQITVDYCNVSNKKTGEIISEFNPTVENGKLIIKEKHQDKFNFLNFNFGFVDSERHGLIIKVPAGKEMPVNLKSNTGRIVLGESGKEIKAPSVDLSTDTGRIEVDADIVCSGDLKAETNTGRVELNGKVNCAGNISVETNTGRIVCASEITAKNVTLTADTGRIILNAVKTNTLTINDDTGTIEGNGPIDANTVTANNSTGDVRLALKGSKSDYTFTYSSSTGDSNMSNFSGGSKIVSVNTSTGDITISFKE